MIQQILKHYNKVYQQITDICLTVAMSWSVVSLFPTILFPRGWTLLHFFSERCGGLALPGEAYLHVLVPGIVQFTRIASSFIFMSSSLNISGTSRTNGTFSQCYSLKSFEWNLLWPSEISLFWHSYYHRYYSVENLA